VSARGSARPAARRAAPTPSASPANPGPTPSCSSRRSRRRSSSRATTRRSRERRRSAVRATSWAAAATRWGEVGQQVEVTAAESSFAASQAHAKSADFLTRVDERKIDSLPPRRARGGGRRLITTQRDRCIRETQRVGDRRREGSHDPGIGRRLLELPTDVGERGLWIGALAVHQPVHPPLQPLTGRTDTQCNDNGREYGRDCVVVDP
jgi:hypothetical protein